MAYWAVVVSAERYATERLYAGSGLRAEGPFTEGPFTGDPFTGDPFTGGSFAGGSAVGPEPGDEVVLVAAVEPPVVFGLGRVDSGGLIRYTHRILDQPQPADGLDAGGSGDTGSRRLAPDHFAAVAGKIGAAYRVDADKRTWLVSVDLPIEAPSPAEAVRLFWSYVRELGPAELPAYVAPIDDELAMRAFVLGDEANLDPEEA